MMKFIEENPVRVTAVLIAIALVIIAIATWNTRTLETLNFVPVTYDVVVDLLTPIFLIALFVERAIEVFVTTGRKLGRADKEGRLKKAKEKISQLHDRLKQFQAQLDAPGAVNLAQTDLSAIHNRMQAVNDLMPDAQREERSAEVEFEKYRAETRLVTFAAGVALGLIIALGGMRVVAPLVDFELAPWDGFQEFVFHSIDVVLTAGLLAGGASGIHQIVSVFGDYTASVRKAAQS